jgi:hypothetical protein
VKREITAHEFRLSLMNKTTQQHLPPSARPHPMDRVGYYCWGGPGTIRMIHVKFFNPRIDEESLMTCYDYDYVARVQELFGVTDFWVTYSWGFSDETEEEDRRFVLDRLDNFKKLGIRTHAYIQGPNLVSSEFPDKDWWARDEKNRMIPYYRGRRMTSIHHPEYVDFLRQKIERTHGLGFDGIYVDNIQHGQLGIPHRRKGLPFVFCGDYSQHARDAFQQATGHDIPTDFQRNPEVARAYLDFRVEANTDFIATMAEAAHSGGMVFGSNFYDPKFDPYSVYAIDLVRTAAVQDYVLFENHALPTSVDTRHHNQYIEELIDLYYPTKPVFVVSYKKGIGMAPQFTQEDIDNVFSEAAQSNFHVCLKGGEFTTKGIWHSLYLDDYRPPRYDVAFRRRPARRASRVVNRAVTFPLSRRLIRRYYNPLYTAAFEWRVARFLMKSAYDRLLR